MVILSGCSKSKPPTNPKNVGGSSDTSKATYTSEDNITFLKEYSDTLSYFISKFPSEYGLKITDTTTEYFTSGNAIADSENAVAAADKKLDELDNIKVVNGLGLSDKHNTVIKTKDNYELKVNSLISAMKDGCNAYDWKQKSENLSSSFELFTKACMDAKNQAELKLNSLNAENRQNTSVKGSDNTEDGNKHNMDSPSANDIILPLDENDTTNSYDGLSEQVFDAYVSSEQHSKDYTYYLAGKYNHNNIEYFVIQGGTPQSTNEYYLIDNFSKQNDRYLYPQVYSAGYGGIQADSMKLVYKTKIPKP